jgi:hypothetical protein
MSGDRDICRGECRRRKTEGGREGEQGKGGRMKEGDREGGKQGDREEVERGGSGEGGRTVSRVIVWYKQKHPPAAYKYALSIWPKADVLQNLLAGIRALDPKQLLRFPESQRVSGKMRIDAAAVADLPARRMSRGDGQPPGVDASRRASATRAETVVSTRRACALATQMAQQESTPGRRIRSPKAAINESITSLGRESSTRDK